MSLLGMSGEEPIEHAERPVDLACDVLKESIYRWRQRERRGQESVAQLYAQFGVAFECTYRLSMVNGRPHDYLAVYYGVPASPAFDRLYAVRNGVVGKIDSGDGRQQLAVLVDYVEVIEDGERSMLIPSLVWLHIGDDLQGVRVRAGFGQDIDRFSWLLSQQREHRPSGGGEPGVLDGFVRDVIEHRPEVVQTVPDQEREHRIDGLEVLDPPQVLSAVTLRIWDDGVGVRSRDTVDLSLHSYKVLMRPVELETRASQAGMVRIGSAHDLPSGRVR